MQQALATTAPDIAAELRARVDDLRARYDGVMGADLLRAFIREEYADRIALVSSFGAESAVLLHMIAEIDQDLPVIFLETGKLFDETLRYRDRLTELLGLRDVRNIRPGDRDIARHDPDGDLWSRDPDTCCYMRKTKPLETAMLPFDAWITGRKRFQGGNRTELPTVEGDPASGRIKVNPVATWSPGDLKRYMHAHELPAHPLVSRGYFSIGCMPCTAPAQSARDVRSGRWVGLDKTECGIHATGI